VTTDCTDYVLAAQNVIERNIRDIKVVAELEVEPEIPIGSGCKGCAYEGWCFRKNTVSVSYK